MKLSGFSRRHDYPRYPAGPKPFRYCQVRLGRWICLPSSTPTPFNRLFRQPAEVPLPRPRVARMASAGMLTGSSICLAFRLIIRLRRMLTGSSICLAFRLIIRLRLTPGRLTSPGNPWSYGGGESHPPYRYLCLHLLFQTLHGGSRLPLRRRLECSPTDTTVSRGFSAQLDTRLLSMPDPSTSELLRTL